MKIVGHIHDRHIHEMSCFFFSSSFDIFNFFLSQAPGRDSFAYTQSLV